MPQMPKKVEEGIIKGMYRYSKSKLKSKKKAHLMGSGSIMTQVIEAKEMLETMDISTDIWSVTSYTELQRDALNIEREHLLSTSTKKKENYLEKLLAKETGVFVSTSDYMKSMGIGISKWIKQPYTVLGTDGYGLSESREDLRDHFEISPKYIALAALQLLHDQGSVSTNEIKEFIKKNKINLSKANPAGL